MNRLRQLVYAFFAFISLTSPVHGQEATEGRITEHNVVSIVALTGLLLFSYLVRRSRKSDPDKNK